MVRLMRYTVNPALCPHDRIGRGHLFGAGLSRKVLGVAAASVETGTTATTRVGNYGAIVADVTDRQALGDVAKGQVVRHHVYVRRP